MVIKKTCGNSCKMKTLFGVEKMKKTIYILTAFLLLSASAAILAQDDAEQRSTRSGSVRALERQVETLKNQQEKDLEELRSIHKIAIEEKATKTAQRLANLIEKRQNDYITRLAALQERLKTIRDRSGRQELAADSGRKAPDFNLSTFDGKPIKLSDYPGKTLVLEWMNFECPFSRYHYETKPTMVELAKKYKDQNVVWLTINSTSHTTPQANLNFAKQYKIQSPILDDRSGKVGKEYGAITTPHIYIINVRGNIVYDGAIDNAPVGKVEGGEYLNYVDKALSEIIGGKTVGTPKTKPYGCTVKYPN
jgi:peroxiredoxin